LWAAPCMILSQSPAESIKQWKEELPCLCI
jgi:hypothetical protein